MSIWKLVRLKFGRHAVHFGELGIGLEETSERVRSDTLFSAWISAYARLFEGEVEELLKKFDGKSTPPVKISSTFIYQYKDQDIEPIYYLPKPLKFPQKYSDKGDDATSFKTYKKLDYLPLDIWQRWYQGEGFTNHDTTELETVSKDYKKAFKPYQLPKIAVDRVTQATNFYQTGLVQFQWEQNGNDVKSLSGLYFLLYFPQKDETLAQKLYASLNLLGEEGLGGERSSGAGRFEIEYWGNLPPLWKEVVCFNKDKGKYYSLISLFWSESIDPELLNDSSYELIERGGWLSSPSSGRQSRRKKVRMFTEGSVFTCSPEGQLADVTPEGYNLHKIYRSGISLSLPIIPLSKSDRT